jgi:hypothetical protein
MSAGEKHHHCHEREFDCHKGADRDQNLFVAEHTPDNRRIPFGVATAWLCLLPFRSRCVTGGHHVGARPLKELSRPIP